MLYIVLARIRNCYNEKPLNNIGKAWGSFRYAKDGSKTCEAVGGNHYGHHTVLLMTIGVDKAFEAHLLKNI